ncbi:MAG: hypothetical protein QOF29_4114 [bacterium]
MRVKVQSIPAREETTRPSPVPPRAGARRMSGAFIHDSGPRQRRRDPRRARHYGSAPVPVAETTATAVAAFAATNIDDIIVLSVLFARRGKRFHAWHIVAGQYLGFACLVAASLAAGAGLLALPDEAVGALGLIPVALGMRGLWRARRLDDDGDDEDAAGATAMTTAGVAAITVANGADNIAIYAPLFATIGTGGMTATLLVFFALIALWCLAGLLIASRPVVVRIVEWAGQYAIPVVLIALGTFILVESGMPQTLFG